MSIARSMAMICPLDWKGGDDVGLQGGASVLGIGLPRQGDAERERMVGAVGAHGGDAVRGQPDRLRQIGVATTVKKGGSSTTNASSLSCA